jgi:hypothetical protein
MRVVERVILCIVVIFGLFYVQKRSSEVRYVLSSVDGRRYLVRNKEGKKQAANKLARLNKRIEKLIAYMEARGNDPKVERLLERYSPESISEGTGDDNYTAYSVNKGEQLVFCLRSKNTGKFVSDNVLMYVAVHELAHIYSVDVGHTENFWRNFRHLLRQAVSAGAYKKQDYASNPVEYCGVNIKSSII